MMYGFYIGYPIIIITGKTIRRNSIFYKTLSTVLQTLLNNLRNRSVQTITVDFEADLWNIIELVMPGNGCVFYWTEFVW